MSAHPDQAFAHTSMATVLRLIALLALCSAYIQGAMVKSFSFDDAIAEMAHFGLHPERLFAIVVILFELTMCALILSGYFRWIAACAVALFTLTATFLAFRFWELAPGLDRTMMMNGFFEHLGLVGGFLIVALDDLHRPSRRNPRRV